MSSSNENKDATDTISDAVVNVDDGVEGQDPENQQQPPPDQANNNLRLRHGAMSTTSRFYDRGNKGYLDETEELVRSYDKNGDGKIDMTAAMDLAHTARAKERKVQQTRTWAIVATVAAMLFAAATFGLVWVALILSKEVETNGDNALVSTNSKTIVKTYSQGCLNHFKFLDELIQTNDGDTPKVDDEGMFLLGHVPMAEVENSYAAVSQDFHVCTVMYTFSEVEYARKIDPTDIARKVDPNTGNIHYDGILVRDNIMGEINVVVTCETGETNCQAYRHITPTPTEDNQRNRSLQQLTQAECDFLASNPWLFTANPDLYAAQKTVCCIQYGGLSCSCFSPNSSVVTESKGQINIMDLAVGDRVLSSDGSFSTVYTFGHRSRKQKSNMLRIETESAAIELSGNHFIYLADKKLPVLASSVLVGDQLVQFSNDSQEYVTEPVLKITMVEVEGIVAPITVSGDIVVDNILASSYVGVGNTGSEYYYYHGEDSMLNIHSHVLSHVGLTPLRLACNWVSMSFCSDQYHNTEENGNFAGFHVFISSMHRLVDFVASDECGILLHVLLFVVVNGSFFLLFVLENFLPAILLCGGILSCLSFIAGGNNPKKETKIGVAGKKNLKAE